MDDITKDIHKHKLGVENHVKTNVAIISGADLSKGKMTAGNVHNTKKKDSAVEKNIKNLVSSEQTDGGDVDAMGKSGKSKKTSMIGELEKMCGKDHIKKSIDDATSIVLAEAEKIKISNAFNIVVGSDIEKGRKDPIGTIRNGRKKIAEGKWVPVKQDGGKKSKVEEYKEKIQGHINEKSKYQKLNEKHIKDHGKPSKIYSDAIKSEVRKIESLRKKMLSLKKSIEDISDIEKGKKVPVGTVSGNYKKVGEGKWKHIGDKKSSGSTNDSKTDDKKSDNPTYDKQFKEFSKEYDDTPSDKKDQYISDLKNKIKKVEKSGSYKVSGEYGRSLYLAAKQTVKRHEAVQKVNDDHKATEKDPHLPGSAAHILKMDSALKKFHPNLSDKQRRTMAGKLAKESHSSAIGDAVKSDIKDYMNAKGMSKNDAINKVIATYKDAIAKKDKTDKNADNYISEYKKAIKEAESMRDNVDKKDSGDITKKDRKGGADKPATDAELKKRLENIANAPSHLDENGPQKMKTLITEMLKRGMDVKFKVGNKTVSYNKMKKTFNVSGMDTSFAKVTEAIENAK